MFHSNLTVLMNTRQNYGPATGPANPSVSTAQRNEQTVISDLQTAVGPKPLPEVAPYSFELTVALFCSHPHQSTDANLLLDAIHTYRDKLLGEIRDEIRFVRESPDRRRAPDYPFIQRHLDDMERLNMFSLTLRSGLEEGYRHLYLSVYPPLNQQSHE